MLSWIRSPRGSAATTAVVAVVLALIWFAPHTARQDGTFVPSKVEKGPASASGNPAPALAEPGPSLGPVPPATVATLSGALPAAPSGSAASGSPEPNRTAQPVSPAARVADLPAVLAPIAHPPNEPTAAAPRPNAPTPAVAPSTRAAVVAVSPDQTTSPTSVAASPSTPPAGPGSPPTPAFDIVSVEPSGDTVVAGRGAPGSEIFLVDGGTVVANVVADANGQFALLPPRLGEGDHYLTLESKQNGSPAVSGQGVAVSVAKGGATKPMVALLTPDRPAQVLSDGAPAPTAPAAPPVVPKALAPVTIQSVEVAGGGKFMAAGVAGAGSQCRLYLNGAFLADVTTGRDGRWSVKVEKGMRAGKYTVRADQLEPSSGRVVTRAEVPFDYPAAMQSGHAKRMLMARASTGAAPASFVPGTPVAGAPSIGGAVVPPGAPLPASARSNARPSVAERVSSPAALTEPGPPIGRAHTPAVASSVAAPALVGGIPAPVVVPDSGRPAAPARTLVKPPEVGSAATVSPANKVTAPAAAAGSGGVVAPEHSLATPAPQVGHDAAASSAAPRAQGQQSVAMADAGEPQPVPAAASSDASAAAAIVKELQTATVIHGDSLWRISRKMLGHGINYTEIYASNASQIRDPRLIYPGQIFVVPNRDSK